MPLRTLLLGLAKDRGIEIDPEELDAIGLSEDDDTAVEDIKPPVEHDVEILSSTLPGSASGLAEIFLEAPKGKVVEHDGLLWSPIAVEGQWAMRPDGKGGKVRAPLKLVSGSSTNQRRQIGMADIVSNFDDGAVEQVTIPTTHNNGPLENTGYVEKLKIVDGKAKGKTVKVLMAGENYTDKVARQKVLEGSTRGRSMGLLYDYERTDTAKSYPVALEHVALTPKPWLRGMPKLARPLSDPSELATVSLSLSDDGPSEDDLETLLSDAVNDDTDFLAEPAVQWSHEDSPQWLRQQVDDILREARREKLKKFPKNGSMICDEPTPSYRCTEAKPGSALIADGWGDGANYWVATITVADGKVSLAGFKDWASTKQVWVADEREQPKGDKAPLSDVTVTITSPPLTDPSNAELALRIAQARRRGTTLSQQDPKPAIEPPRGGGEVDGSEGTLQLSDEARALIKAAEDKSAALEVQLAETNKKVDALLGTNNVNAASAFITHLKAPVESGGLGLSEERGFGGMLVEIEQIMLADDGGPAVQSDHFADEATNKDGTLTISESLKRVFGALRTAEGSTLKLGEIIEQPIAKKDGDSLTDGKPPKDDTDVDVNNLSDDELLARHEAAHPGALEAAGIPLSQNGTGKAGD